MWYWWRIVKLSVILSFLPQGSSSIFEFATNTNVGESRICVIKNRPLSRSLWSISWHFYPYLGSEIV